MTYCSPNLNELKSMLLTLPGTPPELPSVTLDTIEENAKDIALAARKLLIHYNLKVILVTLSECGVIIVRLGQPKDPLPTKLIPVPASVADIVTAVWYPCTSPCEHVVSVSGAGDCLTRRRTGIPNYRSPSNEIEPSTCFN